MAATNFSAIYVNNEGKIIEREIPGMNTYKIAEKFAKMLNDPEETKLVCVVESWKLHDISQRPFDTEIPFNHTIYLLHRV